MFRSDTAGLFGSPIEVSHSLPCGVGVANLSDEFELVEAVALKLMPVRLPLFELGRSLFDVVVDLHACLLLGEAGTHASWRAMCAREGERTDVDLAATLGVRSGRISRSDPVQSARGQELLERYHKAHAWCAQVRSSRSACAHRPKAGSAHPAGR